MKTNTILFLLMIHCAYGFAQFSQEPLPYKVDALEPYIDSQTMDIHFNKHHAGYIKNLNTAVKGTATEKMTLLDILSNVSKLGSTIRNNAGGHYNHQLFWKVLTPNTATKPSKKLERAINETFTDLEALKVELSKAGSTQFGSGWAWLYVNQNGKLSICSTANQNNPLMDDAEHKGIPILGIDVWEHAYYLKYQNQRGNYLNAIWNIINWDEVSERYEEAITKKQ
ncbi:superoxide dismutase [Confluentibacter sediminis]|uniref:superoxide dismutase n=1 Tax=Confluentibacter sediminis TaxID=2219045 RepID=UPI000DAB580C|nr:superoxide dismutase [Confluentibacter sediminis]